MKTVRLLVPLLIGTHNHPAGARLTLEDKAAIRLIDRGHASLAPFDPTATPPPPARRVMIAATTNPAPRKAARIAGQAI